MTHDEMIAVIQAHKDGKQIQCLCKHPGAYHEWADLQTKPVWDFHRFDYRIKPEEKNPREWFVAVSSIVLDSVRVVNPDDCELKSEKLVRVREVLE